MELPQEQVPLWRTIPSPLRRDFVSSFGRHAEVRQTFLDRAVKHIVPALTTIDLDRAFQRVLQGSTETKDAALAELQRLMIDNRLIGRNFDFHHISVARSQEGANEIQDMMNDALLPLLVTGAVEPEQLLSVQEFIRHTGTLPAEKQLQGLDLQPVRVFDSYALRRESAIRSTSLEEFGRLMLADTASEFFFEFDNLLNNTDKRMTPSSITNISLEAIRNQRIMMPFTPPEYLIAATTNAVTPIKLASLGQAMWAIPISGAQTWSITSCQLDKAQGAYHTTFPEYLFPPNLEFCAVNLSDKEKGACWIQPPGQKYWTYTSQTAFFVCGHFYTAELFPDSLCAIRRQLCEGSECNEEPTAENFKLLRDLIQLIREDDIFTPAQVESVAYELHALLEAWNSDHSQRPQWYTRSVESQYNNLNLECDYFIEAVENWDKRWFGLYEQKWRSCRRHP